MVRTQALFTNFCVVWFNLPPSILKICNIARCSNFSCFIFLNNVLYTVNKSSAKRRKISCRGEQFLVMDHAHTQSGFAKIRFFFLARFFSIAFLGAFFYCANPAYICTGSARIFNIHISFVTTLQIIKS